MTVLTHRVLDSQGRPLAGVVATVAPYPGRAGATGTYHRDRATSATSSDDGVLSWVLPPWTGPGVPSYVVSGIEARQVLVAVPRTVSTATVTETRTGTLPLPPGQQQASQDLVTQTELVNRLAGLTTELAANPDLKATVTGIAEQALATGLGSRAAADPVLSNFVYDPATGNLLSYKEDGVAITLTYNADGTVATSKRGTAPAKTYSYTGGNLTGVA